MLLKKADTTLDDAILESGKALRANRYCVWASAVESKLLFPEAKNLFQQHRSVSVLSTFVGTLRTLVPRPSTPLRAGRHAGQQPAWSGACPSAPHSPRSR